MSGSTEFYALERLLKGIESPLPAGVVLVDGHDIVRRRTRIKWWQKTGKITHCLRLHSLALERQ